MNKNFLTAITALALFGCDSNNSNNANTTPPQKKGTTTNPPAEEEGDIVEWNAILKEIIASTTNNQDLDAAMNAPGLKAYVSNLLKTDSYLKNLIPKAFMIHGDEKDGYCNNFLKSIVNHGAEIVFIPGTYGDICITTLDVDTSSNHTENRKLYYIYKDANNWKTKISKELPKQAFNDLQTVVETIKTVSNDSFCAQEYVLEHIDEFQGKLATGTAKPTSGFAVSNDGKAIVDKNGKILQAKEAVKGGGLSTVGFA